MASAALYLFLNLFASPSTPYLLGGDQTFFWLGGQRMLYGDRVYIDFLRFTSPGADVFFQASSGWPGLYLPLQLRDPLFLSTVSYLEAARPEDISDTVQQLKSTPVPLILWTAYLDLHCSPGQRCEDHLTPLRDYLARRYTLIETFSDGDILWQQRNP